MLRLSKKFSRRTKWSKLAISIYQTAIKAENITMT
jgi:hypothetical protein